MKRSVLARRYIVQEYEQLVDDAETDEQALAQVTTGVSGDAFRTLSDKVEWAVFDEEGQGTTYTEENVRQVLMRERQRTLRPE